MSVGNSRIEKLRFLGGRLCLDFTNTMDPRLGKHPQDYLSDYADLVQWSLHASLLTDQEAAYLQDEAQQYTAEATSTFERAITLREAMYQIFSAIAGNTQARASDLETVKTIFAEALTHAQLSPLANSFRWNWPKSEHALDQMVWPVVDSAVQLLTSAEVEKVKECPGVGDCGWLFLDTSKNGSRQWCSMEGCGSRVKMRRQYARKRAVSIQHDG